MNKTIKIYIAGHRGMVGNAISRRLSAAGYHNTVARNHSDLDLTRQDQVEAFFKSEKPDVVVLAAARVGGILANNVYRAEFIYENSMIAANVVHAAWKARVAKLINLGSSCIFPKYAPQPMQEGHLLTGSLEPTNEPYAIAKILAIKLCRSYHEQYGANFMSVMPSNLYGPHDNFDLETGHVLAALVRKIHEAKETNNNTVTVWGDGTPLREFLYVDDLADAVLFLLENVNAPDLAARNLMDLFVNVGSGEEISIRQLAEIICEASNYRGRIKFDTHKPNGSPRKLMDSSHMRQLGWTPRTQLKKGITETLNWYRKHNSYWH